MGSAALDYDFALELRAMYRQWVDLGRRFERAGRLPSGNQGGASMPIWQMVRVSSATADSLGYPCYAQAFDGTTWSDYPAVARVVASDGSALGLGACAARLMRVDPATNLLVYATVSPLAATCGLGSKVPGYNAAAFQLLAHDKNGCPIWLNLNSCATGSGSGSGAGGIATTCCPNNRLPTTLHMTCGTGGTTEALVWDGVSKWAGADGTYLQCAGNAWRLVTIAYGTIAALSASCSPLDLYFQKYDNAFPNPGLIFDCTVTA